MSFDVYYGHITVRTAIKRDVKRLARFVINRNFYFIVKLKTQAIIRSTSFFAVLSNNMTNFLMI